MGADWSLEEFHTYHWFTWHNNSSTPNFSERARGEAGLTRIKNLNNLLHSQGAWNLGTQDYSAAKYKDKWKLSETVPNPSTFNIVKIERISFLEAAWEIDHWTI